MFNIMLKQDYRGDAPVAPGKQVFIHILNPDRGTFNVSMSDVCDEFRNASS